MANGLDRTLCLGVACWAISLLACAGALHPVPADATAECDGYLLFAQALRDGELPRSGFQPLLYPALVAALSMATGDVFAAARVVSVLAAAAALLATYSLGRALGRPALGAGAAVTLAVNFEFVRHGLLATSDMLFIALALATLCCAVRHVRGGGGSRTAALLGASAALAWSARYVAITLAVPVVFALLHDAARLGRCLRAALVAAATALVVAAPQLVANASTWGTPLYSESWRNLAMKVDAVERGAPPDWTMLTRPLVADGWTDVVAASPAAVASGLGAELGHAFGDTLPRLLAPYGIGVVLEALLLGGLVAAALRRAAFARGAGLLWGFALAYLLCIAGVLFAWMRLLVPLLPVAYLLAFASARSVLPPRVAAAGHAILLALLASALPAAIARFGAEHATGEHAAAAWLARTAGPQAVVVGTHADLGSLHRLDYHAETIGFARGGEPQYLDVLHRFLDLVGADWVVVGEKTLGARPRCLLDGTCDAPFLAIAHREPGGIVYRVVRGDAPAANGTR